jgi:hypothetical protein
MPAIAQSLDYRVDVGIIFIRLVRNACHYSRNCGAKVRNYSITIFCVFT